MGKVVALDERHAGLVEDHARKLGITPEEYLHGLIDADARSFDEILEPARRGFLPMSDDELDDLFDRAKRAGQGPQ